MTHVLTHTGISDSGQGSAKWTFDLRDCSKSGHKRTQKHRIARDFRLERSSPPIKKCISEDLADIYQDLKDFIGVFQSGLNVTMNDSLCVCKEHFAEFWGQRLVNTMRALHDVKYNSSDETGEHTSWDNDEFDLA